LRVIWKPGGKLVANKRRARWDKPNVGWSRMAELLSGSHCDTCGNGTVRALRLVSSGAVIVAHKEDTVPLRRALLAEGFAVDEVRGPYTAEQLNFSAIMRCMVNHANAWRIAADRDRPTIVVEADFVPVKGFGDLPAPIPTKKFNDSIAYLYSVGPQVWDLAERNVARGHGGGAVALLIPQRVALLLMQFFEEELKANPLGEYSAFDTKIGYWLLERGINSFIPYRHYGEHGGIGNPEHVVAGLGRPHQADVLQGKLAFLPTYANGSVLRFWKIRIRARLWGIARLLCGRFLAWHDFMRSDRLQMIRFAVGRFLFRSSIGG
jgi:hypothetical protein